MFLGVIFWFIFLHTSACLSSVKVWKQRTRVWPWSTLQNTLSHTFKEVLFNQLARCKTLNRKGPLLLFQLTESYLVFCPGCVFTCQKLQITSVPISRGSSGFWLSKGRIWVEDRWQFFCFFTVKYWTRFIAATLTLKVKKHDSDKTMCARVKIKKEGKQPHR